jgi:hypothetical protein
VARDEAPEVLSVAGREVRITHPSKPYFSREERLSKLDVVRYYLSVADGALAGIRDRPLVLKRFVDEVASLHLSRCGDDAWLRVDLRQDGPNPRAVGATVTVEAGGRAWTRRLHAGGTGFAAGQPPEVHIGLGDLDAIDRGRVRWPDGGETVTGALDTRQTLRIWR